MPYSLFYSRFPEIAERETRTVTLFDHSGFNLPPARYSFLEMFCDEPGCDCRRAFFSVVSSLQNNILAVIAWGWEDREFYTKWLGDSDPRIINDLIGPALNLASPQSNHAPALLDLFTKVLLQDTAYIERVKRHYAMFRQEIESQAKTKSRGKKRPKRKRKKRKT
jgi:hypothetical protein